MITTLTVQLAQILDCGSLGLPRCGEDAGTNDIKTIMSIVFLVAGGVSVLYILIGAGKFAAASGDPANLKKARDTILYAVIGLVVSLFAFSIVNFVVGST